MVCYKCLNACCYCDKTIKYIIELAKTREWQFSLSERFEDTTIRVNFEVEIMWVRFSNSIQEDNARTRLKIEVLEHVNSSLKDFLEKKKKDLEKLNDFLAKKE